jgi:anti-anti-sigma factor
MDHTSDGSLTCTLQNVDGVACLALAGEINTDNALVLKAHLRMAGKSQTDTIVLDLTDLENLSSSAVDAILDSQRTLALQGQMIVLAAPSPSIRKVLAVLRSEGTMPVFASVEEALTYLGAVSDSDEPLAGS